jgi:hypothetical protein
MRTQHSQLSGGMCDLSATVDEIRSVRKRTPAAASDDCGRSLHEENHWRKKFIADPKEQRACPAG